MSSLLEQRRLTEVSPPALSESYPATPASVPEARAALTAFAAAAGLSGEQLDDVRVACSEALTNGVLHAYPENQPGRIHVTAGALAGELLILIADDGVGMRSASKRSGLGLGLGVIARVCESFEVAERACGGTELRLRFALPGAARHPQLRGSFASARDPA